MGCMLVLTHEPRAHGRGDDRHRPEEEDQPGEHVAVVTQRDDGDDGERHLGHADAAVDLPFRVGEEDPGAVAEEDDGPRERVEGDEDVPGDGAVFQGEDEEAVVAPHRWSGAGVRIGGSEVDTVGRRRSVEGSRGRAGSSRIGS